MDGFRLSKWVRTNTSLPIFVASGDANKPDAAHEPCAEGPFLKKPYDLEYAVAQIRQTISSRKK